MVVIVPIADAIALASVAVSFKLIRGELGRSRLARAARREAQQGERPWR